MSAPFLQEQARRSHILLHEHSNDYSVMVRSIVLVALSDIRDEELLLNYRLNPALEAPAWYAQVDSEEDERRWS